MRILACNSCDVWSFLSWGGNPLGSPRRDRIHHLPQTDGHSYDLIVVAADLGQE